jgi:5'-phosphate synthase pdxT subunit
MVGVLALQGDFAMHRRALELAGARVHEIRTAEDLDGLEGIVLPGGESGTMLRLLERSGLEDGLRDFHARGGPLFGTCAGLILLAGRVDHPPQRSLALLDAVVERNAYGRQIDSFEADLEWTEGAEPLRGVFIRAPRIREIGPDVRVLARYEGEPVLVRNGHVLAATFHPELTEDLRLHAYFLADLVSPKGDGGR